jgi:plasmid stabilization system protein ParE
MKVRFLDVAQREMDDAVVWYDQQASDLGIRFLAEVHRAIRRSTAFPESCPEISPELRRCLLARFPYGLIYGIDNDTIVVVAVAHLHREPRYWLNRLKPQL